MNEHNFEWSLLPAEIVYKILGSLDVVSLVLCRQASDFPNLGCGVLISSVLQLNKVLKNLIDESTALQYKIELEVAGMEDGPPSSLGASDRLALLGRRQDAWAELRYTSRQIFEGPLNDLWHLSGGVLAQLRTLDSIEFLQLPSEFRGIESKEWTISDIGFEIIDFAMDSSQDLLVMIEGPQMYVYVPLETS